MRQEGKEERELLESLKKLLAPIPDVDSVRFEEERKNAAVLEWCAENGISVVRDDPGAGDS